MRTGTGILLGLALTAATAGSAMAAPITFTWTPTAIGLTGGPITGANNFNVADFADIQVNNTNGNFIENGVLTLTQFLNNGTPIAVAGYGTTDSLYVSFTATGTSSGVPANNSGTATTGSFSTLSYTIYANPNGTPTVTPVTGATPTITGNAGAFAIATGSLISGTTTLTAPAGGGLSPQANLNLSFVACSTAGQALTTGGTCTGNETAFFTAPPPSTISMLVGNFGATTTVTTTTPSVATTFIDINGGGGNVTLAVPEPASLALLGTGILGLGLIRRNRKRA